MMTITYCSDTYIKDGFHKRHEAGNDIINKDLFLSIVRCARQVLKNDTLGNINEHQGNTTLFRVRINENSVYSIHSDTKISALREMYKILIIFSLMICTNLSFGQEKIIILEIYSTEDTISNGFSPKFKLYDDYSVDYTYFDFFNSAKHKSIYWHKNNNSICIHKFNTFYQFFHNNLNFKKQHHRLFTNKLKKREIDYVLYLNKLVIHNEKRFNNLEIKNCDSYIFNPDD